MACHNNVRIYNAFLQKKSVLFAAILANVQWCYLVHIMQRDVGQLQIMLKKVAIFITVYIFFIRNTW